MVKATIFEAKTNLSALVKKAQSGEVVIITSGRKKIPVAILNPIEPAQPVAKKRWGLGSKGCQSGSFLKRDSSTL